MIRNTYIMAKNIMSITPIIKTKYIANTAVATVLGLLLFLIGWRLITQEISILGVHGYRDKVDVERKRNQISLDEGMLPFRLDLAGPFLDHVLSVDGFRNRENIHSKVAYYAKILVHISPANARAWCALSFVEFPRRPSELRVLDYLVACYQYGVREGTLQPWRLEMAFAVWEYLPNNVRSIVIAEIIECLENIATQPAILRALGKFALGAPERSDLARILVELQDRNVIVAFEKSIEHHRHNLINGKLSK